MTGALGGRAAEELILGAPSTGAENDLQQATQIARQMVTRWGMSPKVGMVSIARSDGGFLGGDMMPEMGREISEETASLVDEEVRRIVTECFARAADTLLREKPRLIALAETLLRRESLDEREMLDVTGLTGVAASKLSSLSQKVINVLPDASDAVVGPASGTVTEDTRAPVAVEERPA